MPDSPVSIFVPQGAAGEPDPPAEVFNPPVGGGEPDSPLGIFAPSIPPAPSATAAVTIDPSGTNNSVTYTAKVAGVSGNSITVAYGTPAGTTTTTVSVTNTAITVTPAAKARMTVGGSLTSNAGAVVPPGPLEYLDQLNGRPRYQVGTSPQWTVSWFPGTGWVLSHVAGISTTWRSTSDVATPDLATGWGANPGSAGTPGGTPTFTAGAATAAAVIAAVNAHPAASALVTAAASGTVTGSVAAVAATALTGGAGGSARPPAIFNS